MAKPPLKVADGEPVEETIEIVFVAGTDAITPDFYGVMLAQPVRVRVPLSALQSLDGE